MNKPFFENARVGDSTIVEEGVRLGHRYHADCGPARIGAGGIIRAGTIIYGDVGFGDYLQTGHHAVIRAHVTGGNHCCVFNHCVLEGRVTLGNGVRLMTHVYLPSRTEIGDDVFIGPGTVVLNDRLATRYPEHDIPEVQGPIIEPDVAIGGGCTLLPGIRIGAGSFVAAGSLVTRDVPPETLAIGSPAEIRELPESLRMPNSRRITRANLDLWHPHTPSQR